MVYKVAHIEVRQDMADEFMAGVKKAAPLFLSSEGCRGLSLERSVEFPEQFVLRVQWDSVAHNLELFVNSENFKSWRALVGHCFARKPQIYHTETLFVREEQMAAQ